MTGNRNRCTGQDAPLYAICLANRPEITAMPDRNAAAFANAFWVGEWDTMKSAYAAGGIDLNEPDEESGFSWLHSICRMGHVDIARWLIGNGAKVDAEVIESEDRDDDDDLGATPLMLLADSIGGNQVELIEMLLDAGADINHIDAHGQNIVHRALEAPSLLQILLARGADPNIAANDGETPLMRALLMNDDALARLLRANGARDGDMTDVDFQRAVFEGDQARVRELLAAGANVNFQRGGTAVSTAVYREDLELLQLLVDAGADINLADSNDPDGDFNPLLRAAYDGQEEIVGFLLNAGADTGVANHGLSPLDYAKLGKREGHNPERPWDSVIEMLRAAAKQGAATLRGKRVAAGRIAVVAALNSLLPRDLKWSRFAGAGIDIIESEAIQDAGCLDALLPTLQDSAREHGFTLSVLAYSLRDAEPRLAELTTALASADATTADAVFSNWEAERSSEPNEPGEEADEYDWTVRQARYASLENIPDGFADSPYNVSNGAFLALTTDVRTIPVAYRFGGWNSAPLPYEMGLVARHWLEKFGAELLAIDNATLAFRLRKPLADIESVRQAAREIGLFCDESESADSDIGIAASARWSFWWD